MRDELDSDEVMILINLIMKLLITRDLPIYF
jgi:hypothetical protein